MMLCLRALKKDKLYPDLEGSALFVYTLVLFSLNLNANSSVLPFSNVIFLCVMHSQYCIELGKNYGC